MEITREKFIKATGREPEKDDLERCNCPYFGHIVHTHCGWNYETNKPQFFGAPHPWNGLSAPVAVLCFSSSEL